MIVRQEDLTFIQVVSLVASRCGCAIEEIDLETRTVSITCPGGKDQEIDCATAISEIMEGICDTADSWVFPAITRSPVLRDRE